MLSINKILAPVDFSDDSRRALDTAVEMARKFGATLYLLHVVEVPVFGAYPQLPMSDLHPQVPTEEAEAKLAEWAASVKDVTVAEKEVVIGHPATFIVDYSKQKGIDLIVIATLGRRGLARLLVGSTTERVVRTADCLVLTTRHPG